MHENSAGTHFNRIKTFSEVAYFRFKQITSSRLQELTSKTKKKYYNEHVAQTLKAA